MIPQNDNIKRESGMFPFQILFFLISKVAGLFYHKLMRLLGAKYMASPSLI